MKDHETDSCGVCRFWWTHREGEEQGMCYGGPPSRLPGSTLGEYPWTYDDWWCGQFQDRERKGEVR